MSELLHRAVAAHGGLDRFSQFKTVSASVVSGGALWSLKGQAGGLSTHVTVDLHQEHVSFQLPNQRAVFTPQRIAIETDAGAVVAERAHPRAAFAGHTLETPWDVLDRFYFSGYAMWTYLTVPFSLTWAGFEVAEIEPWQEQHETWRRLSVRFPPSIASHSTEQTFYFGANGLLCRHDYEVEIAGNTPAAHYVSDYKDVSGIMLPTKRRVFIRQPDNTPALDTLVISIDLSDIRFAGVLRRKRLSFSGKGVSRSIVDTHSVVPAFPKHANFQRINGRSQMGSGFSNGEWLCCSLLTPIAHSSP